MVVGTRVHRDHGALKLRGVILQGERRPYADVEVIWNGEVVARANRDSYARSADMAEASDFVLSVGGKLAVKLARSMES